jgi:AF2212-like protein
MMNTIWAVIREGKIIPLEEINVPEGTRVLVTLLAEDDTDFWLATSDSSLSEVWSNAADDVYAELLQK